MNDKRKEKIKPLIDYYTKIADLDYWYLNPEEGGPVSTLEIDFWYIIVPTEFHFFFRETATLKNSKLYKRAKNMRWYATHGGYSLDEVLLWDAEKECCVCGLGLSETSDSDSE